MAAPEPERIGRYRIEAVLGRGAMGSVFRAHDPVIDRKVAIKLVRADLLDGGDRAEYVTRFQQEAQAAGRCGHVNIVGIYDFALHEGNPYLAMEFIDGLSLHQMRNRPDRFSPAEIADLGGQVLDGLAAAHALGVIHRDIKPANIMLTAQGRVKVTDFGISRLDTSQLTGAGGVVGTPSYMSPEQCRGGPIDGRTDLFSTAIVLYELLTGAKPFRGATSHEVWHQLLHTEPADTRPLRPGAPEALHAAIARALAKEPAARFASAAEMAVALRGAEPATLLLGAAAADFDRTVLAGPPTGSLNPLGLDSVCLTAIERGLAHHVGPIASRLLRSAIGKAESLDALGDALAVNIADPAERDRFRAEIRHHAASAGSGAGASALPEADLARARAELARFLGPVARVLVKRAAPGCTDAAQLWQRLAQHVDSADRTAFLKSRPG